MPILFNQWRPARNGEERIDYESGLAILLYRAVASGEYQFHIVGWGQGSQRTGSHNLVEARKLAMRRTDLLLREAIDQNAAALVDAGTQV